jgi:hypothetical protein
MMRAMFRHVVMFAWADGIDDAHVAATTAAFDALPGKVDVIQSYVHGPNVGTADGNSDYVVMADFASADDFAAYRDHADHVALVQEFIAGKVSSRNAIQYEI